MAFKHALEMSQSCELLQAFNPKQQANNLTPRPSPLGLVINKESTSPMSFTESTGSRLVHRALIPFKDFFSSNESWWRWMVVAPSFTFSKGWSKLQRNAQDLQNTNTQQTLKKQTVSAQVYTENQRSISKYYARCCVSFKGWPKIH